MHLPQYSLARLISLLPHPAELDAAQIAFVQGKTAHWWTGRRFSKRNSCRSVSEPTSSCQMKNNRLQLKNRFSEPKYAAQLLPASQVRRSREDIFLFSWVCFYIRYSTALCPRSSTPNCHWPPGWDLAGERARPGCRFRHRAVVGMARCAVRLSM